MSTPSSSNGKWRGEVQGRISRGKEAIITEHDSSTSVSRVTTAPVVASGTQYDQDGYIVEITKKKYTIKDLPVPSNDSRWSCSLVSASQPNPWVIPEENLTAAIQVIWNIVFPEIKYRVSLDGSVMGIVRIPLESDHC